MKISTALHFIPILEIHFFSDIHFQFLVITFDYETTTFKIGATPGRTIIFDLRTISFHLVAKTIAGLGATLFVVTWVCATAMAHAYTFLVVPTILDCALSSPVAALLELVTAKLCSRVVFVVENAYKPCSGHSKQHAKEKESGKAHDEKNDGGCSCSRNRGGSVE